MSGQLPNQGGTPETTNGLNMEEPASEISEQELATHLNSAHFELPTANLDNEAVINNTQLSNQTATQTLAQEIINDSILKDPADAISRQEQAMHLEPRNPVLPTANIDNGEVMTPKGDDAAQLQQQHRIAEGGAGTHVVENDDDIIVTEEADRNSQGKSATALQHMEHKSENATPFMSENRDEKKNEQNEVDDNTKQGVLQTERPEEKNNDTPKNEKPVVIKTKTIQEADNATDEDLLPKSLRKWKRKIVKRVERQNNDDCEENVETVEREKDTANVGDTMDTEATLKSKEDRYIDLDNYLDLQEFVLSEDGNTYVFPSYIRGVPVEKITEKDIYWPPTWRTLEKLRDSPGMNSSLFRRCEKDISSWPFHPNQILTKGLLSRNGTLVIRSIRVLRRLFNHLILARRLGMTRLPPLELFRRRLGKVITEIHSHGRIWSRVYFVLAQDPAFSMVFSALSKYVKLYFEKTDRLRYENRLARRRVEKEPDIDYDNERLLSKKRHKTKIAKKIQDAEWEHSDKEDEEIFIKPEVENEVEEDLKQGLELSAEKQSFYDNKKVDEVGHDEKMGIAINLENTVVKMKEAAGAT